MAEVTKEEIANGLKELGVEPGFKLLVHSSLSSLGHVEGGADAVIDALIESVTPGGTVLVPTLTGDEGLSPANPPVFDPRRTPCWTGHIPETFRQRPGAVRSLHPTHSVAAIGPDAVSLTGDHLDSVTPCDDLSPYGKLARDENGYVLLIGVGYDVCTLFHHVEEVCGVDYHLQQGVARSRILVDGKEIIRHILLHRYGTPRQFGVMEPILQERGIQTQAEIGSARVRLVNAREMVRATAQCLRANGRLLCK